MPPVLSFRQLFGLFLTLSLLAACSGSGLAERGKAPERYRLIGYVLGSKGVDVRPADARRLTHINYAFANVTADGRVVLEREEDASRLARLVALKEHNPDLKILLSVGGWSWSDHFSDAALTQAARERFARTAVALVKAYELDGLDLDWEYPGQPGEDNTHRPEDKANFTRLLQTVRQHLDTQSDRHLLTIAAGANAAFLEHTDMAAAHEPLDFVNLMTYDFHGSWTPRTGHHANLHTPADTLPSAAASVEQFIQAGVPAHKIVLGVPFYGRRWAGVQPTGRGLYQSYTQSRAALSYDSLAASYVDRKGFTRYWDEAAQAPYLWNPDSTLFITYEDEQSLARKAAFVQEKGLGGLMYWEHNHDPSGTLLSALYSYLY